MERINTGLEPFRAPIDSPEDWHLVGAHSLLFLERGRAELRLQDQSTRVQAPSLALVPAGHRYQMRSRSRKVEPVLHLLRIRTRAFAYRQSVDALTVDIISQLCHEARSCGGLLPLRKQNVAVAGALLMQCLELESRPLLLKAKALELVDALSNYLPSLEATAESANNSQSIRVLLEQINKNIAHHWNVPQAMALTGLSKNTFHKAFRLATNNTFRQYLIRARVEEAARLIRHTDRTILDISLECGFPTQSRFYQAFREVMQCSPGECRGNQSGE